MPKGEMSIFVTLLRQSRCASFIMTLNASSKMKLLMDFTTSWRANMRDFL
jgi:hypothetical protein